MIDIPGYSMVGQIGKGGMASVYHARQILLDRDVALKVMSPQLAQDTVYAQRFLQEARMLASLNHPHVVQVYDIGVTPGGLHYFSMQLLQGGDFAGKLREGISEEDLIRVLVSVAQALGFAHARGYVHRDVTPGNIMFDAHDVPVLTDFGIARALSSTSRITSSGLSIGTSHYMSPEQARGVEVDARSDIYSLGVVCYEALVGAPPFDGEDGFAVAFAHVHDPVPRLPEEVARWQPLIDRAMAKEPSQRFPDCQAFIEGIRQVAPDEFRASGAVIQPVVAPPPGRLISSNRKAAAAARDSAANAGEAPGAATAGSVSWRPIALLGGSVAIGLIVALGIWSWMGQGKQALPTSVATPVVTAPTAVDPAPDPVDPGPDPTAPLTEPDQADDPNAPVEGEETAEVLPGEPVAEHTVVDPVVTLIGLGQANIARQRLTAPPVTNALARFQTALLIEPDNAQAQQGIADIARAYLKLAAAQDPDAPGNTWLEQVTQAEKMAALTPAGAAAAAEAADLRKRRAATLAERARTAVLAWQRDEAIAAYEAALALQPDNPAAIAGLKLANQIGKPGYRFNDPMDGSGGAQEMVVLDARKAVALHPVRVADFKRYWDAAGNRAFADKMPRCNDKESLALFGSSAKRSWQAPDITQNDQHPVVCVSAEMADAYVAWLSQATGKRYRLPKAAELAVGKAAGCKENIRDASYRGSFGGRSGHDCDDGFAGTSPVGRFPAQAGGLFDTGGNVRIWTQDCPSGNCKRRVAIGRSWESAPDEPDRKDFPADSGFNTIGLRVLRDLD